MHFLMQLSRHSLYMHWCGTVLYQTVYIITMHFLNFAKITFSLKRKYNAIFKAIILRTFLRQCDIPHS